MTATAQVPAAGDEDSIVYLHGVSWDDFERLLEIRGEHATPRFTYLDGEVELMSPSRGHESMKSFIGCLVETWCLEHDVTFDVIGAWLLKERAKKAGVEPDECYIFGDLDRDRPDLAIEVAWSRGFSGIKEGAYHRLGVRELWVWQKGTIVIRARGTRGYRTVAQSQVLPELDLAELTTFLDRSKTSIAMRDYRAALKPKP